MVSEATQSDTVTAHVDYDARSRAVIVEWGSEEKGLRLGTVLDQLVQAGEIPTIGTYTPPVVDLRVEGLRPKVWSWELVPGVWDNDDGKQFVLEMADFVAEHAYHPYVAAMRRTWSPGRVEAPEASTFDAGEDEIVRELEKAEVRRVSEG